MGVLHFQVPNNLTADTAERLRHAYLALGFDHSPVPTRCDLAGDRLTVRNDRDESGWLNAAWDIPGAGRLVGATSTLMERAAPYRLLVELARGKVNQVRSQAAEWKHNGIAVRPEIEEQIRSATTAFGKAVLETDTAESERHALQALGLAYEAAEAMVAVSVGQIFASRQQKEERFGAQLACRLIEIPPCRSDGGCSEARSPPPACQFPGGQPNRSNRLTNGTPRTMSSIGRRTSNCK